MKYNKAILGTVVAAAAEIIEWATDKDIPERIVSAAIIIVVFLVPNSDV